MRIATWNVNSVLARIPRLLEWLEQTAPDVLAVQETKVAADDFPTAQVKTLGYEVAHHGEGRWNGVAIVAKGGLTALSSALPGLTEARYANALCHPAGGGRPLQVVSVYVPNGRTIDDAQYPYKLDWLAALQDAGARWLAEDPGATIALMGDWNIAPIDDDVWSVEFYEGRTHTSAPERAAFQGVVEAGFADVEILDIENDFFRFYRLR